MENIVSRASELLQIMVDEGTTPKAMSFHTGYSYQQTWKYIQGEATPTPDFLNRLFQKTGDLRIPFLIIEGRNAVVIEVDAMAQLSDTQLLSELIKQRRAELNRESLLLQILEDGHVDESDQKVLEAYNAEFNRGMSHAFGLRNLINQKFQSATEVNR